MRRLEASARPLLVSVLVCLLAVAGGSLAFVSTSFAGPGGRSDCWGPRRPTTRPEQAAGVGAVTIQVSWDLAEPSSGSFSTSYLTQQGQFPGPLTEVNQALAAGLKVIIDPGLQYPPQWVVNLPNSQFVNQFGATYSGPIASGNDAVNAVTNLTVRSLEQTYLTWLGQQFVPGSITAVREGGGPLGELRYPLPEDGSGNYNDSYWAYDADTQAALPPSVQGWTPGTGNAAQATTFLDAYNQNLDSYGVWLNGQLVQDFATTVLLMLPGWGERPGVAQDHGELTAPAGDSLRGVQRRPRLARLADQPAGSFRLGGVHHVPRRHRQRRRSGASRLSELPRLRNLHPAGRGEHGERDCRHT